MTRIIVSCLFANGGIRRHRHWWEHAETVCVCMINSDSVDAKSWTHRLTVYAHVHICNHKVRPQYVKIVSTGASHGMLSSINCPSSRTTLDLPLASLLNGFLLNHAWCVFLIDLVNRCPLSGSLALVTGQNRCPQNFRHLRRTKPRQICCPAAASKDHV